MSTSTSRTPSVITTQTSLTTVTLPNGQTSTSTAFAVTTANGQLSGSNGNGGSGSTGFFSNSGAVGGTFAAVGIVCVALVAAVFYMLWRRRKAQRMDADVVAAASAAAATTRTPFDDDDPEMIEDPSYGTGATALGGAAAGAGAYGASNAMMQQYYNNYGPSSEGYEPSHLSGGTAPGYAGMGAYGPMAAGAGGAAAGGAAAYYAGQPGTDGSHYYDSVPAGLSSEGAYAGMGSLGHDNGHSHSQSAHDDPYSANSGGQAYSHTGAPQLNWAPGASPPLDAAYMAPASQGQDSGNVFADPSSSSNETDGRIDMTAHEAGSAVSLRDDQDYGRRLAVRNGDN